MKRALAALAAAVVVASGCGGGTSPSHDLAWNGFSGGGAVKAHRTFSWGGTVLYNKTADPVTLRSVELVGATNGLRLIAVHAVPAEHDWTGLRRRDPAYVRRVPLDGTVVPPREGSSKGMGLLLVYVANPGRSHYDGLSITYEHDGDTLTQTIPSKINVVTKANPRA
jgi:hypothetical protein